MLASSDALTACLLNSADSASQGIVCTEDGAIYNVLRVWSPEPTDSHTSIKSKATSALLAWWVTPQTVYSAMEAHAHAVTLDSSSTAIV